MKCKLKVDREFRDKDTNKIHKVGSVFTVDEVRAKELLAHPQGIVSVIETPNDKPKTSDEAGSDGDNKGENEPENEDGNKNDEGKSSE